MKQVVNGQSVNHFSFCMSNSDAASFAGDCVTDPAGVSRSYNTWYFVVCCVAGVGMALPTAWLLAEFANRAGTRVRLAPDLVAGAAAVTMAMALLSGLAALRSLRLIEPVNLLR